MFVVFCCFMVHILFLVEQALPRLYTRLGKASWGFSLGRSAIGNAASAVVSVEGLRSSVGALGVRTCN